MRVSGTTIRLACLLSFGLGPSALLHAQEDPTIRVDVRLVRILATVKDSTGALKGGIEQRDFAAIRALFDASPEAQKAGDAAVADLKTKLGTAANGAATIRSATQAIR